MVEVIKVTRGALWQISLQVATTRDLNIEFLFLFQESNIPKRCIIPLNFHATTSL